MSAVIHGLFTCLILQNLTGACLLQILPGYIDIITKEYLFENTGIIKIIQI